MLTIELQNGQRQVVALPDRPDPSPEERDARAAANEISVDEVKALCGSAQAYQWLVDKHLLGTMFRRSNKPMQIFSVLNPLKKPRATEFFLRADVVRGFEEVRAIAAALSTPPTR